MDRNRNKELRAAYNAAYERRLQIDDKRTDFEDAGWEKLRAEADLLFGAKRTEALTAEHTALAAFNAAEVASAKADTGWLPEGTKVFKTKKRGWQGVEHTVRGIVEVWSSESKLAATKRYPPNPGTVVVRILKANGTPSTKHDGYISWWKAE